MYGTLGISLKGALVNTLQSMGEWHLNLALINKLVAKETDLLKEMNKMTLKSYVQFITGQIQVPVMHSQVCHSASVTLSLYHCHSASVSLCLCHLATLTVSL